MEQHDAEAHRTGIEEEASSHRPKRHFFSLFFVVLSFFVRFPNVSFFLLSYLGTSVQQNSQSFPQ
jgi:hypothetical protein